MITSPVEIKKETQAKRLSVNPEIVYVKISRKMVDAERNIKSGKCYDCILL